MASFVTEVLASSGRLAKEDLHSKINSLSKHVNDVKNEVQETLDSRYISFFPCLKETLELSNRISSVSNEMKVLSNCIENEMKVELKTSNRDIQELSHQLADITVTLALVEKLLRIHGLLTSVSENLNRKDYLLAARNLEDIKFCLKENANLGEDQVTIFKALKSEYVIRREKLTYDLGEKWNEHVVWTIDSPSSNRLVIDLTINMPNPEKVAEMTSLLHAMQLMHYLDQKLKVFANHFLHHLCNSVVLNKVHIDTTAKTSSVNLHLDVDKTSQPSPCEVLDNLGAVFEFLGNSLMKINVNDKEGGITLMTKLGHIVSKDFCELLIKDCLSAAIPDSKADLQNYQQIIDRTETFQKQLAEYRFLNTDQESILSYAKNIDIHFTNKMCQDILGKARALMLKDLHDLTHMPETEIPEEKIPKEYREGAINKALFKAEQSTFASADKLSKNIFIFPACAISVSVESLVSLIYETLKEAASSSQLCAGRLFYTCRNIVELFCDIVPGYHKDNLSRLPQLSAVFHNNCMYIAHHLMTMGHQFHEHSSANKDMFTTFVDLIPHVRQIGSEIFLNQMLAQKKQILEAIHELGGFHNMANDENFMASLDRALRQCLHQLFFLKRLWENVLPQPVYCQSIGTLLNTLIEELVYQTTSQADIPSDSTMTLISIFSSVSTKSPQLFKVENDDSSSVLDVHQYVGKWMKFKELLLVLGASMKDILDRWAEGKGPLAHEFTVNETKQLIRALFQNTERRAAALAKIK